MRWQDDIKHCFESSHLIYMRQALIVVVSLSMSDIRSVTTQESHLFLSDIKLTKFYKNLHSCLFKGEQATDWQTHNQHSCKNPS